MNTKIFLRSILLIVAIGSTGFAVYATWFRYMDVGDINKTFENQSNNQRIEENRFLQEQMGTDQSDLTDVIEKIDMTQPENVRTAIDVKRRHEADILKLENVVSIGVGYAEDGVTPVITVFLETENSETRARIPSQLEGIRVQIIVSGPFKPL